MLLVLLLVGTVFSNQLFAQDQSKIMRMRLEEDIFSAVTPLEESTWKLEEMQQELKQFNFSTKSYDDLDYVSPNNATWGPAFHFSRLYKLALSFHLKSHPFYQSKTNLEVISLGVDHWISKMYLNHNWWMNEIGVPLTVYKIFILMEDDLTAAQKSGLRKIIERSKTFTSNKGQNLVWYSELFFALGVISKDDSLIKKSIEQMLSTLQLGLDQGIQVDYSFLQHGDVFYNGGYGTEFALNIARFAVLVDQTRFSFSEAQRKHLFQYVLDGNAWLLRGDQVNYSSMGRYYVRPNFAAQYLQKTCQKLSLLNNPRAVEAKNCAEKIAGNIPQNIKQGNKYFWKGDFMVQQEPGYSASVKMLSKRLLNADTTPNYEGLLNDYISDGVNYIFRKGNEYKGIFPVLDYTRLPGTTEVDETLVPRADQRLYGVKDFVGGVSDGSVGVAAMDFSRGKLVPAPDYTVLARMDFSQSTLNAKKSWFFNPQGMVALGTGISYSSLNPLNKVRTSINQTWSHSPISYGRAGEGLKVLDEGTVTTNLSWFHQDEIAYYNLRGDSIITLQNMEQVGHWKRINGQLTESPVKGKVFSAWINHGMVPKKDSYAYYVYPNISAEDASKIDLKGKIQILENSENIQSVEFSDLKMIQAVFYNPGKIKSSILDMEFSIEKPAILSLRALDSKRFNLAVSNPLPQEVKQYVMIFKGKFLCDSCIYHSSSNETNLSIKLKNASNGLDTTEIILERANASMIMMKPIVSIKKTFFQWLFNGFSKD